MKHLTLARLLAVSGVMIIILLGAMLLGVGLGTEKLDFLAALGAEPGTYHHDLLFNTRIPRVILAALAGLGLSVAGVAFQAILRNPLADPYILGVSGGAALGGTLAIALGAGAVEWGIPLLPLSAFAGAMITIFLLLSFARLRSRVSTVGLLLIGVVFNAFAASVITFIKTILSAQKSQEILFWLVGRIDYESSLTILLMAGYVGLGSLVLFLKAPAMNALALGEDGARALGINVERTRMVILVAASLVVGAVVSVTGMIGFVGLVVPHAVRMILGPDHRLLLPVAGMAGAIFLVLADLLCRALFGALGSESPVGTITAFVGGPLFIFLLRRYSARLPI